MAQIIELHSGLEVNHQVLNATETKICDLNWDRYLVTIYHWFLIFFPKSILFLFIKIATKGFFTDLSNVQQHTQT